VDVLLSVADADYPLKLSSLSSKVPSPDSSESTTPNVRIVSISPDIKEILVREEEFLKSLQIQKVATVLEPLRELIHQVLFF
jgi:hypothetical protein